MAERADITVDHEWYTNTDHTFEFVIYQADGTTVQNISGFTFSWLLKRRQIDPDASAIITKTSASGITIISGASGRVNVAIIDTDTVAVKGGNYWHELKRTDTDLETVESYGHAALRQSIHAS